MKLFVVTCIRENQDDVIGIFRKADIQVFSATAVTGFSNSQVQNMMDEWFAAGTEKFDSAVLFSFTVSERAETALELVKKYNEQSDTLFPVRAFVMPVEKCSY